VHHCQVWSLAQIFALTLPSGSWRFPPKLAFQASRCYPVYFRDLPSLSQRPEAFPATVLWYTPLCLHKGLNPVPPSTFTPGDFPPGSFSFCFQKHAALALPASWRLPTSSPGSNPKVLTRDFNGFRLPGSFADLSHLSVATEDKTTLARFSFSRCGLLGFAALASSAV